MKKEVQMVVTKNFCDLCDTIESNNSHFRTCVLCGKLICHKCQKKISPSNYSTMIVCKECATIDEFNELKKLENDMDIIFTTLEDIQKREEEILTQLQKKYNK